MLQFVSKEAHLFTTPIWEVEINNLDNTSIVQYAYNLRNKYPGAQISNRGGWHSKELDTPLPIELNNLIQDSTLFINQYCNSVTGIRDLILGNWWININGPNNYNLVHDHQNALLSVVYYVKVDAPNTGELVIHRDDPSRYYLGKYRKDNTHFSQQSYTIEPKTNKLVIFPAWVKHSVEMNKSNTERISIAFNFVEPK
jgi:uncharacterized protein (TIGR02466 family)